jgi:hypothetical protein
MTSPGGAAATEADRRIRRDPSKGRLAGGTIRSMAAVRNSRGLSDVYVGDGIAAFVLAVYEGGSCDAASQHASDRRALFCMRCVLQHPLDGGSDVDRRLLELPSRLHRARACGGQRGAYRAVQSAARARRCVSSGGAPPRSLLRARNPCRSTCESAVPVRPASARHRAWSLRQGVGRSVRRSRARPRTTRGRRRTTLTRCRPRGRQGEYPARNRPGSSATCMSQSSRVAA